jgi:hypothetical protein
MTKQQAAEKYSNELIAELKKEVFPNESLAPRYWDIKVTVLYNTSFANLQQLFPINWDEYSALHLKSSDFTLFEVQLINTLVTMQTPKDLLVAAGIEKNAYQTLMESIMKMGDVYNELVAPISERIQKRIEIMSAPNGAYKETPVRFIK